MENSIIKEQVNQWYLDYSNDIYQYVLFMIGDHERAKDFMQETFLLAFDKYTSFQGGSAKGWLFRIARNLTIDFIRKDRPIAYLFNRTPYIASEINTPEKIATLNETEKELYCALHKLRRAHRDVIILRKIKDFSIQETANILEWSESKVKTTLLRGLKALKEQLEKEGFSQ
ncbi:RNA polymerase sigma factor [Anaerobacillus alkaliphilus]|uniref:RNA polymerase sigma factor n=1 Tax=Anaerobacillus alkaliphilus TaxID=1548597 RepID=A0A4Q0VUU8_9BACI|nr:RNA polymerase sigma factor [Anaerobacillus alkaliphilus]RXJ02560.1 RNA polymerase sigma factor [Anaerobacillus alkaliphilus]